MIASKEAIEWYFTGQRALIDTLRIILPSDDCDTLLKIVMAAEVTMLAQRDKMEDPEQVQPQAIVQ